MAEAPHDNIYATDVLLIIIDRFIDRYKYYVLLGNFLPFIVYMILTLAYIQNYAALPPAEGYEFGNTNECKIRVVLYIMMSYTTYFELRCLYRDGSRYFFEMFNYIDWTGNLLLLIAMQRAINGNGVGANYSTQDEFQNAICVLSVVSIWFKSLQWLRLFENTSFFIGLIVATLDSIKWFLLIMVLLLLTFGNATTIQSIGRYDPLYSDYFESQFLNTFINQYELSLGEFTIVEKFATGLEGSDPLAWFFFFLATMLS